MVRQGYRYHITISVTDGWYRLWARSQQLFHTAWQQELMLRAGTIPGPTRFRVDWTDPQTSVAWVSYDDRFLVPYGILGSQRLAVGKHPFQATISL